MHSSIFNFKNKSQHWVINWILVVAMCFFTLFTYEAFLKKRDFTPSIDGNNDLWSYYKSKTYNNSKALVLLGASRSLLGINLIKLKELLPKYEIVQLSLNGKYPMATLFSYAKDEDFNGTLVISILSQAFEKIAFNMQTEENEYYENNSSWYKSIDAYYTAFLQSKFRFLHPSLGIKDIVNFYDNNKSFQKPFYISNQLDRSIFADYSKTNSEFAAKSIYESKLTAHKNYPTIAPENWIKDTVKIENAVKKIQQRGGNVIFVRFPTDKGFWQLDEKYYSRALYWDIFASQTAAHMIHFKDVKGLDQIDLPDTNHIDQKDTEYFTETLVKYMLSKKHL